MEERSSYTFGDDVELRTLKFGRLETGDAYVKEPAEAKLHGIATKRSPVKLQSFFERRRNTRSRTWRTRCASTRTTSSLVT